MNTTNPPISPALRPIMDLEALLREMIEEHRKLLMCVEIHQGAMQSLNTLAMETSRARQEAARTRIVRLEDRRRNMVMQIARINQIKEEPKIPVIAELYPQRRQQLLKLRQELMTAMQKVADRSFVANKVAGAVLGHLNTAMRILASAVGSGGIYTNRGTPKMARRIGTVEAVG
jgi:hypothetical protein